MNATLAPAPAETPATADYVFAVDHRLQVTGRPRAAAALRRGDGDLQQLAALCRRSGRSVGDGADRVADGAR